MNHSIKKILRKVVPRPAKRFLARIRLAAGYAPVNKRLSGPGITKRIILMATPEHGNLGDHAIACGELAFFHTYFPDLPVIEITGDHYRKQKNKIIRMIRPADVICITGGGFLGTLWPEEENLVRDIMAAFALNKIIVLPSTLYYEESENGRARLNEAKSFYRSVKYLTLCLRDASSLAVAQAFAMSNVACHLVFAPDMALFLNRTEQSVSRAGVLLCLRKDREKIVEPEAVNTIIEYVVAHGKTVRQTTTVLERRIVPSERDIELDRMLAVFRQAELVITDRLHGMIFAAITSTPCIAMGNMSGKVSGVYEWIKQLDYVRWADSVAAAITAYDQLSAVKQAVYNPGLLSKHFQALSDSIK